MSLLIIEIVKGHEQPVPRTVQRGTDKQRDVYDQRAYMYNGGAFPQEFRLSFDAHTDCLPVGKYVLDPLSFQAGRWGDLELKRNLVLKPAQPHELSKAS
ncbi:single-stranded DNA-binding protein [Pseudoalteromonas sp. T1lg22]|uniref:single-stranded DNA-binding protein n=1 Tax=Pseudoalteromonas sp. T1lg22 TaxID=2077096 RepID=UPI000CF636FF|nr:single-stranded DNA-binding protein [Pseudoalteromonas sp. T1lg22]